jgi:hypothetical protein
MATASLVILHRIVMVWYRDVRKVKSVVLFVQIERCSRSCSRVSRLSIVGESKSRISFFVVEMIVTRKQIASTQVQVQTD